MTVKSFAQSKKLSETDLNDEIVKSIRDSKGKNIIKMDLRELEEAPTDFFIICEGTSNIQVKAISDRICKDLKEKYDIIPSHLEGEQLARWILVDFFTTVVHIFYPETRQFYQLDDLWSDAKITEYSNL